MRAIPELFIAASLVAANVAAQGINQEIAKGVPSIGRDVPSILVQMRQMEMQRQQLLIQQQQADAAARLTEQQAQAIELDNEKRRLEPLQGGTSQAQSQGTGPSQYEQEIFARWQKAVVPRSGLFEGFFDTVLADDVPISMDMIALIGSSPYAADISYYLAKNKQHAARIFGMPMLDQAAAIRALENDAKIR